MSTSTRILCFGDSLTWGWAPVETGLFVERYPFAQRWPGVMAADLGPEYEIIEEGLSGRTTTLDDPTDPRLNGAAYLPAALASHLPLDLVILMLGTNDTKAYFHRSAFEIAAGMSTLIGQVASCGGGVGTIYPAPKILLVAPPPLAEMPTPWFAEMFRGGKAKTEQLAGLYRSLADIIGLPFLDAGSVTATGGVDGIHFTVDNNAALGHALAGKVKSLAL